MTTGDQVRASLMLLGPVGAEHQPVTLGEPVVCDVGLQTELTMMIDE